MTDREKMNNAIAKVISASYKKDAKEFFKLVESEYEVFKREGWFCVRNDKTDKTITISNSGYGRHGYAYNIFFYKNGNNYHTRKCYNLGLVDFVGILETPLNKAALDEYWGKTSDSYRKAEKLRSAKWNVRYHQREIVSAKEKFERAMKEYESSMAYNQKELVKAKTNLSALRQEYGLKER